MIFLKFLKIISIPITSKKLKSQEPHFIYIQEFNPIFQHNGWYARFSIC